MYEEAPLGIDKLVWKLYQRFTLGTAAFPASCNCSPCICIFPHSPFLPARAAAYISQQQPSKKKCEKRTKEAAKGAYTRRAAAADLHTEGMHFVVNLLFAAAPRVQNAPEMHILTGVCECGCVRCALGDPKPQNSSYPSFSEAQLATRVGISMQILAHLRWVESK